MQSANNPISHHTSHTMGQGAASSNGGDNSCGANCVDNHVGHAIGDGDGVVRVSGGETGNDGGVVMEASVTDVGVSDLNQTTTTTSNYE
ncbi:homocitrate synthase, partial [Fusarium pseudoanthophilum]